MAFFRENILYKSIVDNYENKILVAEILENIFPEKVSHDLWKSNHFLKIGKKR